MIVAFATLALGSLLGAWTYYAGRSMAEEKLDETCLRAACKGCPFADIENNCCKHPVWSPSLCILRQPVRK